MHRDVTPGAWCDDDRALADALAILRLPASDLDKDRLALCVTEACELITDELDRGDTPITGDPVTLRMIHAELSVELYRRKDAPFGVLNAWSPEDVALRISSDPMVGFRHRLEPWKLDYGVAG